MKYVKYIIAGIISIIIIGLLIGGFFLLKNFNTEPFTYKDITEISYGDLDINNFVKQNITCNTKGCSFNKKDLKYTFSEITTLGKQELTLEIEYENKKYSQSFNVSVKDKESPTITLSENAIILKVGAKFDAKSYLKEVNDNYDTLKIEDITIESSVDTKNPGTYEVIYKIKDSSNNEGTTKLTVIVNEKGNTNLSLSPSSKKTDIKEEKTNSNTKKEVEKNPELPKIVLNNSNTVNNSPSSSEETPTPSKEEFIWNIKTSGVYKINDTLSKDNSKITHNEELEVGWEDIIEFESSIKGNGLYNLKVVITDISGNYEPYTFDKDFSDSAFKFQFELPDVGKYEIILKLTDKETKESFFEEITLNLKWPKILKDVKLESENKGDYEAINFYYLGGEEVSYGAALVSSNDPKTETEDFDVNDILMLSNKDDEDLILKYEKGYYYNVGVIVTDGKNTITKIIKIEN